MSEMDVKTKELVDKLSDSRDKLETYVGELEELKEKISSIFPTELNYRNKFALEEKVKTMSEFYNSLLRLRQEVNKTIKDEIEIRRKSDASESDEISSSDIRKLAQELDRMQKEVDVPPAEQILK